MEVITVFQESEHRWTAFGHASVPLADPGKEGKPVGIDGHSRERAIDYWLDAYTVSEGTPREIIEVSRTEGHSRFCGA